MAATTSTTAASSGQEDPCLIDSIADENGVGLDLLEAPALSAWRVGAMLIPSAGVYHCPYSPAV
jgi:hypothetical protein